VVVTASFAAGYLLAALVGRTTVVPDHDISMVWPAAAVSVLWIVARAGSSQRWADFALIGLLTALAVLATAATPSRALWGGAAAVLQCVVCDALLRRFCPRIWRGRGRTMLDRHEMWWFASAAFAGPAASAPLLEIEALLSGEGWTWSVLLLWVARNFGSILVLVPFGFMIATRIDAGRGAVAVPGGVVGAGDARIGIREAIEQARQTVRSGPAEWVALLLLGPMVHVAWFLLIENLTVFFPLLVLACWAGLRLPTGQIPLFSLLVAAAVIGCTLNGYGPIHLVGDPVLEVAVGQLYVVVFCGISLALALDRDERVALSAALAGARDEARSQAMLFGTIFDTMSEGVRVVDRRGNVIARNPAASRLLLGESTASNEARPGSDLDSLHTLDGRRLPDEAMPFRRSLAGEDVRDLDLLVRTPDAERIVSFTTARLPEAVADGGVVTVLRDVTIERQELMRAARVQAGLLPTEVPPLPGYDLAARTVPAGSVGGDFYDWYGVDDGAVLTLADVMGKGAGAAILAATTRSLLRAHGADENVVRPMTLAEESMQRDLDAANAFVTVFRAFIHAPSGDVTFADAGHGLAAVVAVEGVRPLDGGGLPLGIGVGESRPVGREHLEPGETLLVVSDGVLDALGGSLDDLDRVWDAARTAKSAADAVGAVVDAALSGTVEDDLTVLVLRREK
jgi:PAS domain-containing protein